jgi:hypothetical protein
VGRRPIIADYIGATCCSLSRYRAKDKHIAQLMKQAAAVSFVWNFCNEVQTKAAKEGRKWLNRHDLDRLIKVATKEGLDLHSQTVQKVREQYDNSRQQHRKPWLNWRKTRGSRRSLGWISRPRGIAGQRIRDWTCDDCGAVHDRHVNAATNILRLGLQALVEGAHARKQGLRSPPAFRRGSSHVIKKLVERHSQANHHHHRYRLTMVRIK